MTDAATAGVLASRTFSATDQETFAALSGDRNAMHMDPVAARRTQAGAPVVHGVHVTLWALETLAAHGYLDERAAQKITVHFATFVYVGAPVSLDVRGVRAGVLRASVRGGDAAAVTIAIAFSDPERPPAAVKLPSAAAAQPLAPDLAAFAGRSGRRLVDAASSVQFPAAAARLGAPAVDALAQLSTLVGMECPGEHSIFGGFELVFAQPADAPAAAVDYTVLGVDERFRMLQIGVRGSGIDGVVTAFARMPPVAQSTPLAVLRDALGADRFAGTTALVVGGSRGLGAHCARAIVAAGGRAIVTYVVGDADARALVGELGDDACAAIRCDVLASPEPFIDALPWIPDQLYYFASPQIYRQKRALFEASRFRELCAFYVDGFAALITALAGRGGALKAYYPSTTFVADPPREMAEYAAAKAAGEALCTALARSTPGVSIVVTRLPRVLTDQTATVVPTETVDAFAALLPVLHAMSAPAAS